VLFERDREVRLPEERLYNYGTSDLDCIASKLFFSRFSEENCRMNEYYPALILVVGGVLRFVKRIVGGFSFMASVMLFCLSAAPVHSETFYEGQLRDLKSLNFAARAKAAYELGSICETKGGQTDCKKITAELERALQRESCEIAASDSCLVFRGIIWALTRCASVNGKISPVLLETLKTPVSAGARLELESDIGATIARLASGDTKKEGLDPVRQVIEVFRSDPNHIDKIATLFAASLQSVLDKCSTEDSSKSVERITSLINTLIDEKYYREPGKERLLLDHVKVALTASLARSLSQAKISDHIIAALCPSDALSDITRKLVDVLRCRLDLMAALSAGVDKGSGRQAEFLLRLLELPPLPDEGNQHAVEGGSGQGTNAKAGSSAPQEVNGRSNDPASPIPIHLAEANQRQNAMVELLLYFSQQKQASLEPLKKILFTDQMPFGSMAAIVREATRRLLLQGQTEMIQAMLEWKDAVRQDLTKPAVQSGFAEALHDVCSGDDRKTKGIRFLASNPGLVLLESAAQEPLFEDLVSILGCGDQEMRSASLAAIAAVLTEQQKQERMADYYNGHERHFLNAFFAASAIPAMRSDATFWAFAANLLAKINSSNVPKDRAWMLTDRLLDLWQAKPAEGKEALPSIPLWLRALNPKATANLKDLDQWKRWWQLNRYYLP
jgi:hypothetical protein